MTRSDANEKMENAELDAERRLLVYYPCPISLRLFTDIGLSGVNTENLLKTLSKLFILTLFLSLSGLLPAAQVGGLYQAEVVVSSQEAAERREAFGLALKEVLVRVAGKQSVLANPELVQAISQPDQLVQKFSYETVERVPEPESEAFTDGLQGDQLSRQASIMPTGLPGVYRLNVTFSRTSVNNLLKQHGEPVWGNNRPTVLLWMATDTDGLRNVVGAASDSALAASLKKAAKIRGVPLYLPVMDLQDESAINSSDIWGLFIGSLADASARYGADSVVVSRLSESDGDHWSGRWVFELRGALDSGMATGKSSDQVAMSLIGSIAEKLSERYAIKDSEVLRDSELELEISDIKTMEDYVGATRYIESLPPVDSVQLNWVKGERIRFVIKLRGYLAQLQEHIELDTILLADMSESGEATDLLRLYYRWSRLN